MQGEVADVAPIVRDEREQRQYTDRDTESLSDEDRHGRGNYLADGILLMGVDEERGTAPSPSSYGRTLMTVFPVRRSVELKVATASSMLETLPMFVRSRPSRIR